MHVGHCDALGEPPVAPEDRPLHGDPRSTSPCFSLRPVQARPSAIRSARRGRLDRFVVCASDVPRRVANLSANAVSARFFRCARWTPRTPMPVPSTSGRPAAPPTATLVLNAAVLSSCRHRRISWSVGSRPRLGPLSRLWGPPHSSSESLKAATLAVTGHAASLRIGEAAVRLPPTKGSSTRALHFPAAVARVSCSRHGMPRQCHVQWVPCGDLAE